jgi:prevent-host-death family protein
MPSIKPVSDLRNYGEVLRDVAVGQPVFLTKNGRGRHAVIDMEEYREYEKMKAMNRLLSELNKGRISGEQDGWLSADEVFRDLEARYQVNTGDGSLC